LDLSNLIIPTLQEADTVSEAGCETFGSSGIPLLGGSWKAEKE
jgi:hypothetical protein